MYSNESKSFTRVQKAEYRDKQARYIFMGEYKPEEQAKESVLIKQKLLIIK